MKRLVWKECLSLFVLIALAQSGIAQNTPITTNAPVVSITATDPSASEIGPDPGAFTVWRKGATNDSLTVWCHIGGTASNGVDYQQISNIVIIPVGASSALVTVTPIPDTLVEGPETVEMTVVPSPLLSIMQYL